MTYLNTYPAHHAQHAEPDVKADLYANYDLPQFIDMAPLEAALRGLCALVCIMSDKQLYKQQAKASRRMHQAVKGLIAAGEHNIRLETKLAMLASPEWRARVLRDLGGDAALERWVRIMDKRRAAMDALFGGRAQERPRPSDAQLIARAANLQKAKLALFHKRFQHTCRESVRRRGFDMPNPNSFVDRYKVDQEGQFRLAPLKRFASHKGVKKPDFNRGDQDPASDHKLRYSALDPIELYPAEFHAAQLLEARDRDQQQTKFESKTTRFPHTDSHQTSDSDRDNKPVIQPEPD